MIFGKYINKYYIKYAPSLLLGLLALITVDYLQLRIPELYRLVVNGINSGYAEVDGVLQPFTLDLLLDEVCLPLIFIILALTVGRFLWRICIFGAGIKVETDLRGRMFDHLKELSADFYSVNKVGNLMSLFTNDLDTVQECYGWGFMQFFDPIILCSLAITRMWRMDHLLTVLSLIPMGLLFASAAVVGKNMTRKWDYRQKCFSDLSDFAQESFSGIAVIKAFVKEAKELMAFEKLNRDSEDSNIAFTKTSVLMRILVTTFVESVICVILGYGGYLVYKGQFNAGQLMEFIGYFNAVVGPMMAVADLIDMTSRGKASLKRISELLDAPKNVFDRPGFEPVPAALLADFVVAPDKELRAGSPPAFRGLAPLDQHLEPPARRGDQPDVFFTAARVDHTADKAVRRKNHPRLSFLYPFCILLCFSVSGTHSSL